MTTVLSPPQLYRNCTEPQTQRRLTLTQSSAAFPKSAAGRHLHHEFRGLLSVHSRYGLHARGVAWRPFIEGSSSAVTVTTASIATGWSEPVPGRDSTPAEHQRFCTAHADHLINRNQLEREQQPIEAGSELEKWLDWAEQQADRLDPLVQSPPSILDRANELIGANEEE